MPRPNQKRRKPDPRFSGTPENMLKHSRGFDTGEADKKQKQINKAIKEKKSGKKKTKKKEEQLFTPAPVEDLIAANKQRLQQNFTPAPAADLARPLTPPPSGDQPGGFQLISGGFEGVKARVLGQEPLVPEGTMGSAPFGLQIFMPGSKTINVGQKLLNAGNIKKLSNLGLAPKIFKRVSEVNLNPKTVQQTTSILKKFFSPKTLALVGAWAGAVFLGKWGQAESKEPLEIIMGKELIPNAQKTNDWSLVKEAQAARDEILDLAWWEEVALWSPISPLIGIPKKIEGAIAAAKISDKLIEDLQTGESDDDRWARLRQEQATQEKANIDYYNAERKKLLEWEQEAQAAQRKKDAAFWAKERAKQRQLEEKDRKAIADFWTNYRKEMQKLADNNRPSNLNFGLL